MKKVIRFSLLFFLGILLKLMAGNLYPFLLPVHFVVIGAVYVLGKKLAFMMMFLFGIVLLFLGTDFSIVIFTLIEGSIYITLVLGMVHVSLHEFINLSVSYVLSRLLTLALFQVLVNLFQLESMVVYHFSIHLLSGFVHVFVLYIFVLLLKNAQFVTLNEEQKLFEW